MCKLHESDISPGSNGGSRIAIQGFLKPTTIQGSFQYRQSIRLQDPTFMTPYYRHCGSVSRSFRTRQYKSCYTCFTQNTVETGCKTRSAQSAKYSFGRTTCRSQGTTTFIRYIEPIESSKWISPMVVAYKPEGQV